MADLLQRPELAEKMGNAARAHVERSFSREVRPPLGTVVCLRTSCVHVIHSCLVAVMYERSHYVCTYSASALTGKHFAQSSCQRVPAVRHAFSFKRRGLYVGDRQTTRADTSSVARKIDDVALAR